ncbi:hypothetical protein AA983_05320 [Dermacoccus sp. PE3]|nr:hypothetical protein AA983_05320 [Dermacoccus sp. PE3]
MPLDDAMWSAQSIEDEGCSARFTLGCLAWSRTWPEVQCLDEARAGRPLVLKGAHMGSSA